MCHELWQLSQENLKVTATSCPQGEVEGALLGRAGFQEVPGAYACTWVCAVHLSVSAWVHTACTWMCTQRVCGLAAVSQL